METQVYTIRDAKTGIYSKPFHAVNEPDAIRSFAQVVKDPRSVIATSPEDYDLYKVGTFDDQTGIFTCLATPEHRVKAVTLNTPSAPPTQEHMENVLVRQLSKNRSKKR